MRPRLTALFAVLALPPAALAQLPRPQASPQPAAETKPKKERIIVREYEEARSVALFAACDGNSDDRLDIFEARSAFESVGEPKEIRWYRRLDQDRDGFLDWPEFDRFYRDLVKNGNALHLTLARELKGSAAITAPLADSALRETISIYDKDRDGKLNSDESKAMLRSVGAPPEALVLLQLVDKNRDGLLDESELTPHWKSLSSGAGAALAGIADAGKDKSPQATALATLDLDANGSVSVAELARALRRIDPQLARWAPQIHEAADADKDGALRGSEVPTWNAEAIQGMVERASKR